MSRRRSWAAVGLGALFAANALGQPLARIEARRAGPVELPLSPPLSQEWVLRDILALGPNGEQVPVETRTEPDPEREEIRGALQVSPTAEGGTLLEVGFAANPLPDYDTLLLSNYYSPGIPAAYGPVTITGSEDGLHWVPIVTTERFQVPRRSMETSFSREPMVSSISLPPVRYRSLRITLPEDRLQFSDVRARPASTSPPVRVSPLRECHGTGGALTCRLWLPAPYQVARSFTLVTSPGQGAGFRLLAPFAGRWFLLAQGSWPASEQTEKRIPLPADTFLWSRVLRLELYGSPKPPKLLACTFDLASLVASFYAPQPGQYTLSFQESGSPPATALAALRLATAWPVQAPRVQANGVVRLEISPEIRAGLPAGARLRLEADGRQIPHARWTPDEPVPMSTRWVPWQEDVDIPLSGSALGTMAEIRTQPAELSVAVQVRPREDRWSCRRDPLLPCLALIDLDELSIFPRFKLRLTSSSESHSPPGMDITLWRRRELLVFRWPAEGTVRLVADTLPDKKARGGEGPWRTALLAEPWKAATLGPAQEPFGTPHGVRIAVFSVMLVLVGLLGRALPRV